MATCDCDVTVVFLRATGIADALETLTLRGELLSEFHILVTFFRSKIFQPQAKLFQDVPRMCSARRAGL